MELKLMQIALMSYFVRTVKIPRIKRGEKQELETLINEEALLFAKYLRNEKKYGFQELPS